MHELRGEPEPGLAELLRAPLPRRPRHRRGLQGRRASEDRGSPRSRTTSPSSSARCRTSRAIAADCPLPDAPVPVLPLDDIGAVADAALALAEPLAGRRSRRSPPPARRPASSGRARLQGRGALDLRAAAPTGSTAMAQLSNDCFAFGGELMSVDEARALIAERIAGRRRRRGRAAHRGRRARAGRATSRRPSTCRPSTTPPSTATRCASPTSSRAARPCSPVVGRDCGRRRARASRAGARRGAHLHRRADAGGSRHGLHAGGRRRGRRRGRAAGRAQAGARTGGSPARTRPRQRRRLPPGAASRRATSRSSRRSDSPPCRSATPLRVAVFSTGDEVVSPGEPLAAGKALRRQPLHAAGDAAPARLRARPISASCATSRARLPGRSPARPPITT